MFDPSSVTLVAPVDAALLTITELGAAASNVSAVVSELTCQPVVNDRRRCVQTPCGALERNELSEVHNVLWLVVAPTRDGLL